MGNWFSDHVQVDSRYRSTAVVNDRALLEPIFRAQVDGVVAAAAAQGIDLVPIETFRSAERQQRLYSEGKTKLRKVGTHHYGMAVDFAKRIGGKLSWEGNWGFMADLAAGVSTPTRPVISGVDWGEPGRAHSFIDAGHLQGCTLAQQDGLFAGSWYPDAGSVGGLAPLPAAVAVPKPSYPHVFGLTSDQQIALVTADEVNTRYFERWFLRSSMMAFMEIESDFYPQAIRYEPSGVTSYGLMQVLDSTAVWLGMVGDPRQMFDPLFGIFYGLKYAAWGWNHLLASLDRPPTLEEWAAGYNIGYGAAADGRTRPAYSEPWMKARAKWAAMLD